MDAKIDYVYLSTPEKLRKNLLQFNNKQYFNYDHSRIFLSTKDFIDYSLQETKNLK